MTRLDEAIEREGEFLVLNPVLAHAALYQDCKEKVAAWAVSQLTPQTLASFRSPRSSFEVDALSRYILCTDDNALDPTLQKVMSERCTEVVTLESDHSPFLSRPGVLTDLLVADAI